MIRDRDAAYGDVFIRRLPAMSIRDRPTAPRSPWQNGYCERAIGSIRRECLDHVVMFGERYLRHLLRSTRPIITRLAPFGQRGRLRHEQYMPLVTFCLRHTSSSLCASLNSDRHKTTGLQAEGTDLRVVALRVVAEIDSYQRSGFFERRRQPSIEIGVEDSKHSIEDQA
jgi:hypothetical protein